MLILPIKQKWFDMILRKEKLEEYRDIKPYWTKRLLKYYHRYATKQTIFNIKVRNGYGNDKPTITCKVVLRIGKGKQEWGAEPNKEYYVLEIREILEVQNIGKE